MSISFYIFHFQFILSESRSAFPSAILKSLESSYSSNTAIWTKNLLEDSPSRTMYIVRIHGLYSYWGYTMCMYIYIYIKGVIHMVWNMVKSIHIVHWNCTPKCPHSGAPKRYVCWFYKPIYKSIYPPYQPNRTSYCSELDQHTAIIYQRTISIFFYLNFPHIFMG